MDPIQLIILFCVSVVSGSFGTLVGGNSMITLPILILMGLPPHTAIGTDRVGILGVASAGFYSFHRKGMVNYRLALIFGIPCFFGGFIGAVLALQISPELLKKFIIALTVIVLIIIAANPKLGVKAATNRTIGTGRHFWGAFLSLAVGVYAGFYGPGAQTLLIYVLILVFRQTFLESAANMKIAGILTSTAAAATFAYHGAIHIPAALTLFAGCFTGSYIGAHYSDRIGSVWIKRIFIGVVLMMVVKLVMDA